MDLIRLHVPSSPAVQKWADKINAVCSVTVVAPCLLGAIVKRESGGSNMFQIGMPRGPGCGCGLCQITYAVDWANLDAPTYGGLPLMDPVSNLHVAAISFLVPLYHSAVKAQSERPHSFEVSCHGQLAYAMAAGYNAGWGAVEEAMSEGVDADSKTTNGYASDVFSTFCAYLAESHK